MNADGTMDFLTGSFDGGPYFIEGLGEGRFAAPRPILDEEGKRILICAYWSYDEKKWTQLEAARYPKEHAISVTAVDWDDDGDFDLLLGARSGNLFLRLNQGSAEKAVFTSQEERVSAGKSRVAIPGGGAMVVTADWDVDGKWDIVAGSNTGAVYWLRNVGRKGDPRFSEASKLVNEAPQSAADDGETVRPGTRVQVSVGDYNADGLPDLLMGDNHSQIVKGTEFTPEKRTRYDELRTELRSVSAQLTALSEKSGEGGAAASSPERDKIEKRRKEILEELTSLRPKMARHGWVWLFERRSTSRDR